MTQLLVQCVLTSSFYQNLMHTIPDNPYSTSVVSIALPEHMFTEPYMLITEPPHAYYRTGE